MHRITFTTQRLPSRSNTEAVHTIVYCNLTSDSHTQKYNIHQNKPTHPKTRLPNYTHTLVNYTVGVCVNERESVTKFHFPFWQRRAPPRSSTFRGGGCTVSSETDIFTFNVPRFLNLESRLPFCSFFLFCYKNCNRCVSKFFF